MTTERENEHLPVTGRRVASRARVALPARVETLNGTIRAIVRNVSETGAMLEVASPITVGGSAVISCEDLECFGVVVWMRMRWCGIAFDEPIGKGKVLQLRATSDAGQPAAAYRGALNDAARRWATGNQIA